MSPICPLEPLWQRLTLLFLLTDGGITLKGGHASLEECARAVLVYKGVNGCKVRKEEFVLGLGHKTKSHARSQQGDYFFYETAGYCNCPKGKVRAKQVIALIARGMKLTRLCPHASVAALLPARVLQMTALPPRTAMLAAPVISIASGKI